MVLGKLPVPGRPTIWMIVGQGSIALAVGAGGGCLDIFTLLYPFFFISPSLWETVRYRLKYCLKGPLKPKQPTNHTTKQEQTTKSIQNTQHLFLPFFYFCNHKARQKAKWAAMQVATMLADYRHIDKRTTMRNQNRSAALGRPAMKLLGGGGGGFN